MKRDRSERGNMLLHFMLFLAQLGTLQSERKFLNPCNAGELVFHHFTERNLLDFLDFH